MSSVDVGGHAVTARAPSSGDQATVNIGSVDHISIVTPLKGRVRLGVKEGSLVKEGDLIATQVSAAKTELHIYAPKSGYIRHLVSNETDLDENKPIAELQVL